MKLKKLINNLEQVHQPNFQRSALLVIILTNLFEIKVYSMFLIFEKEPKLDPVSVDKLEVKSN
jgi:hypothetical protein